MASGNFKKGKEHSAYKHGMYGTPTYISWHCMWDRCSNPNRKDYWRYGGSKITVCNEWKDFRSFLRDLGVRPEGTTLDRIDNSKGYYKGNVKWSTYKEQTANRRKKAE